jgi:hypothetical protein
MGPGALVAVVLLVALLAVALRLLARRARREREQLDAEGLVAEGELLDIWQEGTAFHVRYRFTPAGADEPVTKSEMASCLRVELPEVGASVKVRYDPKSPQRARMLRA